MLPEPSFLTLQPFFDTLDGLQRLLLLAAASRLLQIDSVHLDHDGCDDLLHLLNLVAAL